jgi:hypothetical protein
MSALPIQQTPYTLLQNYIPQIVAAVDYDLPLHLVHFWVAKRRVRIAEFKKEGEGKRSIYVNKEDIGILRELYQDAYESMVDEGDSIELPEALLSYPKLHRGLLAYLINNCLVDSYMKDREDLDTSVIRKSDLDLAQLRLDIVETRFRRILKDNSLFLKKDVNNVLKKMVYICLFIQEFGEYKFYSLDNMNLRFLTVKVNEGTRLEYREGYNIIDLLLSGEMNGVLGEVKFK